MLMSTKFLLAWIGSTSRYATFYFFFQAEDGIRDLTVTGVQTCALPICAKMTKRRLTALRFPNDVIKDVSRLVELHLRFHGYGEGEWTDSAVRRYVRDAGPLLTRLHVLTRADCTTRNRGKAARLARAYDGLEQRIAELSEQEELDKLRPELDGNAIMRTLGIPPGPAVGKAYNFLLELRINQGELGAERVTQVLLDWAAAEGISGSEPPDED